MDQVMVLTTWVSPFGNRVLIGLEEKGVKYEYQEEPITESHINPQYIDEAWDSKRLLPSTPCDRALARFWADFIDKRFYDSVVRIMMLKDEAQE
ncbi:hypothetical protein SUGI_0721900 [Cryptomeria japonica]|nr:hypothetical protein SUGI_0721900 [Cryptomeria japonica]